MGAGQGGISGIYRLDSTDANGIVIVREVERATIIRLYLHYYFSCHVTEEPSKHQTIRAIINFRIMQMFAIEYVSNESLVT